MYSIDAETVSALERLITYNHEEAKDFLQREDDEDDPRSQKDHIWHAIARLREWLIATVGHDPLAGHYYADELRRFDREENFAQ
jgi:hypothetical protein